MFLLHGIVSYLAAFHRKGERRGRRELVFFLMFAVPAVFLIALFLPPNFVSHNIVFNQLNPEPNPPPEPIDLEAYGLDNGNLRSDRSQGRLGNQGEDPGDEDAESGGENEDGEQGEDGP